MRLPAGLFALAFCVLAASAAVAQEQVIGADPAAPANAWATSCDSSTRGGAASCQLTQRVFSAQNRRLLAALTLRFSAAGNATMVIVTPVGVSLPPGVTFDVDGNSKQTLPFEVCDRNGCYASVPLSAELLAAMQAGQKLNIAIQNTQKQVANVPLTLAGFTAAYDGVK